MSAFASGGRPTSWVYPASRPVTPCMPRLGFEMETWCSDSGAYFCRLSSKSWATVSTYGDTGRLLVRRFTTRSRPTMRQALSASMLMQAPEPDGQLHASALIHEFIAQIVRRGGQKTLSREAQRRHVLNQEVKP